MYFLRPLPRTTASAAGPTKSLLRDGVVIRIGETVHTDVVGYIHGTTHNFDILNVGCESWLRPQ